ncbi:MAG: rhodanese-like domain-containing protein [Pseudobdellovibrionaceae bacterium]
MSQALPLGTFQFENLVKGRVPFLLLRSGVDVESAYGVMEKMHIRNFSLELEKLEMPDAEAALSDRQARKEDPIVVLDQTGVQSKKLAQSLTEAGYINVYFVLGGWQEILSEMQAEKGK